MKKFQLSIPEPCHENWDAMKPAERGRFCGSCQKTVVDFTAMSDRQLAEFFKKPASSVCGRFHNDQLNREVELPKKRIPWVKYFFQVTWPAFVLFLKACNQRDEVVGKLAVQERMKEQKGEVAFATMGMISENIKPADTLPQVEKTKPAITIHATTLVGKLEMSAAVMGDTTILPATNKIDTAKIESQKPLDTVNITGYSDCYRNIIMGGLSISRGRVVKQDLPLTETPKQTIEAIAYPNPIKAGSQLTVSLKENGKFVKQVQLFSSSGALVNLQGWTVAEKNISAVVPSSLAAGVYFLRVVSEKNQSSTVKIIVQ